MGVFKDLAIQELNQETSTAPECSLCGGYNETASNYCFKCVNKFVGSVCNFCGVPVGKDLSAKQNGTSGFKCHEECADWAVYCALHIQKYRGGVK